MKTQQQGIGLLEVMVALILLAVAVLGYSAMQVRSTNVSLEADYHTRAVELARDLHERMRINREGIVQFETTPVSSTTPPNARDCRNNNCSADELALFEFNAVSDNARNLNMSVAVRTCPNGGSNPRHCIYVAWGDTTPTIGTNATDCTDTNNTYHPNAQCVFMESFNHAN